MRKKKNKYALIILLLLVIGVGYAALTSTLNINGNTIIEKSSWDVHFENLKVNPGSEDATVAATIDSTKTVIDYTVLLSKPGDFYEFTVDIVNAGTIDAMISDVLTEGLSSEQQNYIEYTATYADGKMINDNDAISAGKSRSLKVAVKYRDDIDANSLPTTDITLNLTFGVDYIQANELAVYAKPLCIRAEELHTEECSGNDSWMCADAGYTEDGSKGTRTIKYGNLGTSGADPVSGDAFNCDVNGDGKYDEETERFYYVSGLDGDNTSSVAVLIYYSNLNNGVSDYTMSSISNYSTGSADTGPISAILKLPTTDMWSNVTLSNPNRRILYKNGDFLTDFDYTGYAARLLTTQEVEASCNIDADEETGYNSPKGQLDHCNFLLENTAFAYGTSNIHGYWLETPQYNDRAKFVSGYSRTVYYDYVSSGMTPKGVRPVIEVLKTDILY